MTPIRSAPKRIDTAATTLWNHMTVEEMTALDLGVCPPFSPVRDSSDRRAPGLGRRARRPLDAGRRPTPAPGCRDTGSGAVGGMG